MNISFDFYRSVRAYKDYKVVMSLEHREMHNGYITEKIVDAFSMERLRFTWVLCKFTDSPIRVRTFGFFLLKMICVWK